MGRAPCCDKVGLKKGRWAAEEDQLLATFIKANGEGSWRSLPKKAGLLRCGKSCRLRWINYLREDLKRGNISKEEEDTIIQLRANLGNRWSVIAGHLQGRTDNEIKNYWNSHLSKKVDGGDDGSCDAAGSDRAIVSRKRKVGRPAKSVKKKRKCENHIVTTKVTSEKDATKMPDDMASTEIASAGLGSINEGNCEAAMSPSISSLNGEKTDASSNEDKEAEQSLDEIERLVDWDLEEIATRLWDGEGVGAGAGDLMPDDMASTEIASAGLGSINEGNCEAAMSPSISSLNGEKTDASSNEDKEAEQSFDEIDKLVNWDLEEIATRLWDGEGEGVGAGVGDLWPWVWGDEILEDCGFNDSDFGAFKDECFGGWLPSDVM